MHMSLVSPTSSENSETFHPEVKVLLSSTDLPAREYEEIVVISSCGSGPRRGLSEGFAVPSVVDVKPPSRSVLAKYRPLMY